MNFLHKKPPIQTATQPKLICAFLLSLLFLSIPTTYAASPPFWKTELEKIAFSEKIKNCKIVIVSFLPLPQSKDGLKQHERVFTGEYYSNKPNDVEYSGVFIPNNYMDYIGNNMNLISRQYGLKIEHVQNVNLIPVDADLIVFGAVKRFEAAQSANVGFVIQLLNGKTFEPIKSKTIEKSYNFDDVPLGINPLLHTVGKHSVDFQPQRHVLNLTTYLAVLDILKFIDTELKKP
jgi:hypothetical protein